MAAASTGPAMGARRAGAFRALDDGKALPRLADATLVVANAGGAGELTDYDPDTTLFTLPRAVASG